MRVDSIVIPSYMDGMYLGPVSLPLPSLPSYFCWSLFSSQQLPFHFQIEFFIWDTMNLLRVAYRSLSTLPTAWSLEEISLFPSNHWFPTDPKDEMETLSLSLLHCVHIVVYNLVQLTTVVIKEHKFRKQFALNYIYFLHKCHNFVKK